MNNLQLTAISPIDGRYKQYVKGVDYYFSEAALIRYRIKVEAEYLIFLSKNNVTRKLNNKEVSFLRGLYSDFKLKDAESVKEIEEKINHDVKAAEYFIKQNINKTSLKDVSEFVHFGLTSEDINNLSYSLMIKEFLYDIYIPTLKDLLKRLLELAQEHKSTPMLARTHGQPASPTTAGKEFAVFMERVRKELVCVQDFEISAKLNGATGNYNAHTAAIPELDWVDFSIEFIKSFGLEPNIITTQIEPHDNQAKLFQTIIRINNIVLDLDRDMWLYISQDYLVQKVEKGEVGSSTMPHKVNPINFENSEGNIGIANSLFDHFVNKLTISRLQRDLSDSTVLRNIGSAFAHSIIAYKNTLNGLDRISVNKDRMLQDLNNYPEVLSEAIQTILRKKGYSMPYEKLKELTRGKKIRLEDLRGFISNLKIDDKTKKQLLELEPANYVGKAAELTQIAINKSKDVF